jgi:hypothetical protein
MERSPGFGFLDGWRAVYLLVRLSAEADVEGIHGAEG